ncbi:MAG: glycosyltransferase family 2 protein [Chloroflexi bacterium]|nr:MAG: glycosyltransferase family 2 protein [Chloroflexota bacterium]
MPARLDGLSFFFPALNEEENVAPIVEEALTVLPRFADDLEITVVDDGSTDRTGAIADELALKDSRVRVIHHGSRRGYGGAVRSGLVAATKPWVFFTDGDRQFALEDLGRLVEAADGADAVVGYRIKRADPARRLFVAWVYNRLIRLLFGGGWRDVDCAFKLFRRDVFARVPLERVRSNGAFFSPELLITLRRAGLRVRQVGVRHFPRTAHEPKGASPRVIVRAIRDLLRLRARLWLRPND